MVEPATILITNLRLATWKGNDFPPRSTVLIPITSRPVKRTNFISDFSCETALAMDAESRRERVKALLRLPPEERHRVFLEDYDRFYGGGKDAARARASVLHAPVADDLSVVKSSFRFLRSDEDDEAKRRATTTRSNRHELDMNSTWTVCYKSTFIANQRHKST